MATGVKETATEGTVGAEELNDPSAGRARGREPRTVTRPGPPSLIQPPALVVPACPCSTLPPGFVLCGRRGFFMGHTMPRKYTRSQPHNKITPHSLRVLKALRAEGVGVAEIAKTLNVHRMTVYRLCEKYGL